jgi:hypothetical protein
VFKSLNGGNYYLWSFDAEMSESDGPACGGPSRLACIKPFSMSWFLRAYAGLAVVAAVCLLFAGAASAATAQAYLSVSLTITGSCRAEAGEGAVRVRCTQPVPVRVEAAAPVSVETTEGVSGARAVVITY